MGMDLNLSMVDGLDPQRNSRSASDPSPRGEGSGACLNHSSTMPMSASRAASCSTISMRLAQEGLNEQALGLGARHAAGHDVEQEILVELPARRAVGALHVVGKDLEFGLVVHRCRRPTEEAPPTSCARRSSALAARR